MKEVKTDLAIFPNFNSNYKGVAYEERGVLYHGPNFDQTPDIPSSKVCAQLCKDNAQCNFWWWGESSHSGRCSLKSSVSHKEDHSGYISGKKPC